jgi:hypothetical protein
MTDAVSRFSGVAGEYDAVRPRPPADLVALIVQWAGAARPDVVDLGAGTGLSAVVWAGATEDELGFTALREVAGRRLSEPLTWWWTYRVRLAVR